MLFRSRTARISWEPVDRVLLYRVVIADVDGSRKAPIYMNVSGTTLDAANIVPCSSYQISVSSFNTFLEPGEANNHNYTTNSELGILTFEYMSLLALGS